MTEAANQWGGACNLPEPYYEEGGITIYHGDCLQMSSALIADHLDAVMVTDPPYGKAYRSRHSPRGPTRPIANDGDTSARDAMLVWWNDRPAVVFGTWRCPRPAGVKQLLVWDKGDSPGMGDLSMPWGPSHEEVYVFGRGFRGSRVGSVLRHRTLAAMDHERPRHPTPKPISLMTDILLKCPDSWVVFDPFMGSGTTLVAAKREGRRAIGIEIEERYCEMAANRLCQGVLFGSDNNR